MTSLEVIRMTPDEARALTDRIKTAVDDIWGLVTRAYTARVWTALGYPDWDYYCQKEFGTARIRLPREKRREVVMSMREVGMSTRAIGSAIGMDQKTIVNDIREEKSSPGDLKFLTPGQRSPVVVEEIIEAEIVEEVTGTDGKAYPARTTYRKALPGQFLTVATDLSRLLARVEKLRADDRFAANRKAISEQCAPQIKRTIAVLNDLIKELG